MNKTIAHIILGVLMLMIPIAGNAQIPHTISYQGYLTDTVTGNPITDPALPVRFSLHDALLGGTELWSETQSVNVSQGVYSVELGSATPFPVSVDFNAQYYLEVAIDHDNSTTFDPGEELTPRQQLTSTPYAMNADSLEGMHSGDFAAASHVHSGADITSGEIHLDSVSANPVVRGANTGTGSGLEGSSSSGFGVFGSNTAGGNYGYLGSSAFGVGAVASGTNKAVAGSNLDHGTDGFLGTDSFGVQGMSSSGGIAVMGSNTGSGNYGYLGSGSAGVGAVSTGTSDAVVGSNATSGTDGYLGRGSYGAYGSHSSSGNYGYLGGSSYGVFGQTSAGIAVQGSNTAGGNYGYLGSSAFGVGAVASGTNKAVAGSNMDHGTDGFLGTDSFGVQGMSSSSGIAVMGSNTGSGNYGYLGADSIGVGAVSTGTGDAVVGSNVTTGTDGYLGRENYGVYGSSNSGTAGYFTSSSGYGLIVDQGNMGIGTTTPSHRLETRDSTPSSDNPAIYGEHAVTDYYGVGVHGVGLYKGVEGSVSATGSSTYYGVYASALTNSGSGTTYGVYSSASGGTNNYGVYGLGDHGVLGKSSAALGAGVRGENSSTGAGVYGWSSGGYAGLFNGDVNVIGNITANNFPIPSDVRLKTNIESLHSSLSKVLQLNGVSFDWKKEEYPERNFSGQKQIGLIAQDVEKVMPELVQEDSNGYKSVSYMQMVAVLVEAVKELNTQNELLQEEINNLKKPGTYCGQ